MIFASAFLINLQFLHSFSFASGQTRQACWLMAGGACFFPHPPNSRHITNITPVGGLLPLPYCLSRGFLARDTRGYASVEGTYTYMYRYRCRIFPFSGPTVAAMQDRD